MEVECRGRATAEFGMSAGVALLGPWVVPAVAGTGWATRGLQGAILGPAVTFLFTGAVPVLIARLRGEGLEAFGLDRPLSGLGAGLVCALPIVGVGVSLSWSSPLRGGLASLAGALAYAFGGPLDALDSLAELMAVFLGMVTLWPFLAVRARRVAPEVTVNALGAVRTTGIVIAVAALALGLVVASRGSIGLTFVFMFSGALVGVVLLTDRLLVESGTRSSVVVVLAPAAVALLRRIVAGGDPVTTVWVGLLSAGLVVVVSVLVATRRHAWAVVPVLLAATVYLTPMRPI